MTAFLVVAHPGHELLLHHWMERLKPQVCVLTDGSGGQGPARLGETVRVVEATGASVGPVFGVAPDRSFYQAILRRDVVFFMRLVERLGLAISAARPQVVVSDAIEHFNPVHDLASVIATLAARRAPGVQAARYEFPIERPVDMTSETPQWQVRRLTAEALERKLQAAAGNTALATEVVRVRAEQSGVGAVEVLIPVRPEAPFLPAPRDEPFYQTFGRARVAAGVYADLITFEDHMAPLVAALAEAAAPASTSL